MHAQALRSCTSHGCDDGATKAESIFLILSNLAFLLPLIVAWSRRFFREFAYIVVTMIVSTAYHLCAGDVYCWGTDCGVMRRVDNLFAFTLISVVALNLLQYDAVHNALYTRRRVAAVSAKNTRAAATVAYDDVIDGGHVIVARELLLWSIVAVNGVMTVHDPTSQSIAVVNVVFVLLIVAVKLWLEGIGVNLHNYNWPYILGAVAFGAAGILAFYYADAEYWVWHSLWHIAIAIAIFFLFCLRKPLKAVMECAEPLPLINSVPPAVDPDHASRLLKQTDSEALVLGITGAFAVPRGRPPARMRFRRLFAEIDE